MAKVRKAIPEKIVVELIYANRRTCCICREKRHHVQIHHINGDTENYDRKNLAVLCGNCHSRVEGKEGHGRSISPAEVIKFKTTWEAYWVDRVEVEDDDAEREDDEDEDEEPTTTEHEVLALEGDTNMRYSHELESGDFFSVSILSNKPVDVFLLTKTQMRRFEKGQEHDWIAGGERVYEKDIEEVIEDDGTYFLLVVNRSSWNEARVEVDVAIWCAPEEDDDEE